jgi:NAD(P)-dependent dehydrogenase (short-subunit alcohol dehydrogenase family)
LDLKLDGKIALVTGGNKGLGAASARALAADGANLFLTARNQADLDAVAAEIGGETAVLACDLTDADGADRVAAAALERFGRIDILVNCAGASQGRTAWSSS